MTTAAETGPELKPCPFCGKPPYAAMKERSVINCRNDGCFGPRTTAEYLVDAVRQWNTRATEPAGVGALEITDEMVDAGARIHNPFAFDVDYTCDYVAVVQHRIEARKEVRAILTAALATLPSPPSPDAGAREAGRVAELLRLKDRIDTICNNVLCDMKPGWDDSIEGFNKAWDVVRDIFQEEIGRATAAALSSPSASMEGRREEIARKAVSALTKVAAECHRAKWKYVDDRDRRPFDDLHRIGDIALKLRDSFRPARSPDYDDSKLNDDWGA
jgi:hypothetical protein